MIRRLLARLTKPAIAPQPHDWDLALDGTTLTLRCVRLHCGVVTVSTPGHKFDRDLIWSTCYGVNR